MYAYKYTDWPSLLQDRQQVHAQRVRRRAVLLNAALQIHARAPSARLAPSSLAATTSSLKV
jgi:hypothetical protein